MAIISISQAQGLYTDKLEAIYREKVTPTSFLRSFFAPKVSNTKYVSLAVKRSSEFKAEDVQRGTEGNRNTFGKSSRKKFLPPYFEEYLEATELDFYETMWNGTGTVDVATFANWLEETVEALDELMNLIDRSYEFMCKEVFETGVVTIKNGENIDFNRKALSLVANSAGNTWATGTVSPYETIELGCNFIRTRGKSVGTVLNCIMGSQAHKDFMSNTKVKEANDLQHINLDSISKPQRIADGTLHGEITAGSFRVRIWTYNEYYDDAAANHNEYINPKKIIILPETPNFKFMYSGIPQLLGAKNTKKEGAGLAGKKGKFTISEFLDERHNSHQIIVKSAGMPVPVAVDQMWTAQVVV
jgi:hypothetical protein